MIEKITKGRRPIPQNERRQIVTCCCAADTALQLTQWLESAKATDSTIRRGNVLDQVIAHAIRTNFKINQ